MKSTIVKRSIVIAGHKTSISLEDAFWMALKEIANGRGTTLSNVVTSILHYVDNVVFFRHYPAPTWLSPHLVDLAWFVMTPCMVDFSQFAILAPVSWGELKSP